MAGYFDNHDEAVKAVAWWYGKATIYVSMNPIPDSLLARRYNRLDASDTLTSDADIVSRRWLLIDCDAARPSEISSSDEEHEAAIERAKQIREYLLKRGWSPGILADSGNGAHYDVPISLPNDAAALHLVKTCLQVLNMLFGDAVIGVDEKNSNAARVFKLYGTISTKGDDIPARPHRLAKILEAPKELIPVTREQLEELAALLPAPSPREITGTGERFNLGNWLSTHGIEVSKDGPWEGTGHKWELQICPWNPEHKRSAFVTQGTDGTIRAGCLHNSCSGKLWRDLRLTYEPDAYEKVTPAQSVARYTNTSFGRMAQTVSEPVSATAAWDEPPMPLSAGKLPEFPLAALPPVLADMASEIAGCVQVPLDMTGMLTLGVVSSINARRCRVQVGHPSKRHVETLNLYIVIEAEAGEGKGPTFTPLVAPLRDIESMIGKQQEAEHSAAVALYDTQVKRLAHVQGQAARESKEVDRRAFESEIERLAPLVNAGPPMMQRLIIQDVTNEELCNQLAAQPDNTLAMLNAEAGVFNIIKGQYSSKGTMPNMDIYLQAWCEERYIIDRAGRGNKVIDAPNLTICLMVQPAIMRSLAEDPRLHDNGFLGRFLYAVVPSVAGKQPYLHMARHINSEYPYHQLMRRLWRLEPSACPDDKARRFLMTMDEEAIEVYAHFHNEVNARRCPGQDMSGLGAWAGKICGNVARIAGNLHMVKHSDLTRPWDFPIDGDTMAQAWAIGKYLIPHAMEAFGQMRTDATGALAQRILAWINRKRLTHFTFRECWQGIRSEPKDKMELAILRLTEHGYLRLEVPPKADGIGRPRGLTYGVNTFHTATFDQEKLAA